MPRSGVHFAVFFTAQGYPLRIGNHSFIGNKHMQSLVMAFGRQSRGFSS